MSEHIKTRTYTMILYPYEDLNHYAVMDKLEQGYSYCAIDHDFDKDDEGNLKKSHTHVYLRLKSPRFKKPLADELGLSENYLQECRDSKGALLYMIHEGYPTKYQYDPDKVYGPLRHEIGKLLVQEDEGSRILKILDLIDSMPRPCTYRKLLIAICQNDMYGDFRRMGSGVMHLLDEHNAGFD